MVRNVHICLLYTEVVLTVHIVIFSAGNVEISQINMAPTKGPATTVNNDQTKQPVKQTDDSPLTTKSFLNLLQGGDFHVVFTEVAKDIIAPFINKVTDLEKDLKMANTTIAQQQSILTQQQTTISKLERTIMQNQKDFKISSNNKEHMSVH